MQDKSSPRDLMEYGYREIETELSKTLLDNIKACSPRFFEKLVVELLVAMGYGGSLHDASKIIGRSGDGGIDGTIKEDKL